MTERDGFRLPWPNAVRLRRECEGNENDNAETQSALRFTERVET